MIMLMQCVVWLNHILNGKFMIIIDMMHSTKQWVSRSIVLDGFPTFHSRGITVAEVSANS